MKPIFTRLLSGALSATLLISYVPNISASAEESNTPYPYTLFAVSDSESAISSTASNFCVNGNVATNGLIATGDNFNINGTKTENAEEEMIYIFDKIDSKYFDSSNVDEYSESYTISDTNINVNNPTEVYGEATLTGNININTALKALEDVNLLGDVQNSNDAIIFSKYGNVVIDSQNVNLNGLVYAPFGNVTITAQNLNMNNVIIIAENITINAPSVNANYGNNMASFIGSESEPFYVPYDEWCYLEDNDEDGLPDLIEKEIGSDPLNADTDEDMIPDGYEALSLGTDPIKSDTDENGISDFDEDFDADNLSNGREFELNTNPYNPDTDGDTLLDGDEIDIYSTNPLIIDTDEDGLDDGDEIYFDTNPNNPDSDNNGISDGAEKRDQKFVYDVENEDCAVEQVIVSMEGTGNLQKTTIIKSVMNKDKMCSDVVGLVGEPFSIKTTSQYDSATLSFKIDKTKLGDTDFNDLMFLWYDEKNNEFVDLDTIYDSENSIVTIETEHFSKYMVVDKKAWFDNWRKIYNSYSNIFSTLPSYTAICVDCSGSMSTNDKSFRDDDGKLTCYRNLAVQNYVKSMFGFDNASIITFESSASEVCKLTTNKSTLSSKASFYNGGGTNANSAIDIAIDELKAVSGKRSIILLSDGDVNVSDDNIKYCKDKGIKIHTIALGEGANSQLLKKYANDTGGTPLIATTADLLTKIYEDYAFKNMTDFRNMKDTDGDGLPDDIEQISGIPLPNGKLVFTNPNKKDSDGDKLTDGQEVDWTLYIQKMLTEAMGEEYGSTGIFMFKPTSDPTEPDTDFDGLNDYDEMIEATNSFDEDTDDDGLLDSEDPHKLSYNTYCRYNREAAVNYALKWGEGRNPDYREYATDCANFVSQCIFNGNLAMNRDWHCYYNGVEGLGEYIFTGDFLRYRFTGDEKHMENWDIAPAWRLAQEQCAYFSKDKFCESIYIVENATDIEKLVNEGLVEPGDLAYCSDDSIIHFNRNPYHATFISYVENNNIYYAAHTSNYVKRDMKQALDDNSDNNMKFTVIHLKDVIIYD